ncbi:MAG: hydantoinase/oxoprolinase family protein [Eubacterium aggregans]|uniref:hydantoinase/oxoprolinase family protein n=1 Tax=Eubacterium aggregans TaxID=81409 RepID=UPI002B21B5AD|nr:hydantoinase/oxoprolinase family protein [Eubacterium aggregans]MEA5073948.1 hydantoinase/oxoprolinase family protein [Eubacterium aggregans]
MSIVLGIDTGGTYTDAVLYQQEQQAVLAKSKSPTTRGDLAVGIQKSIEALDIKEPGAVAKVVLSTTLATNAIVEGEGRPAGLIIIGEPPKGELPQGEVQRINGRVNVKGKEVIPLDPLEVRAACDALVGKVEAVAIAGMMSVRNAVQELAVKAEVKACCGVPVVCSHELSSKLGFHDRTVTTVLNASLIPIIEGFIQAVEKALKALGITAPIYMVKGDGNLASLAFIREKPIESILSGPAASIIGALALAGTADGIVVDMGGTTTDSGVVRGNTLALSPVGARVGSWQTQVNSVEINTFGLGGDTQIIVEEGDLKLTGQRILPACRGGQTGLTPTDILHLTGEYMKWSVDEAKEAAVAQAEALGVGLEEYHTLAQNKILTTIEDAVLAQYRNHEPEAEPEVGYVARMQGPVDRTENLLKQLPIIGIGAPAGAWYGKLGASGEQVILPEHFEVANAVGAACAAVEEQVCAIVRPDEANDGYVAHVAGLCQSFSDKDTAVAWVSQEVKTRSLAAARCQGAQSVYAQVFVEEIVEKIGWRERYVQSNVRAVAKATGLQIK